MKRRPHVQGEVSVFCIQAGWILFNTSHNTNGQTGIEIIDGHNLVFPVFFLFFFYKQR